MKVLVLNCCSSTLKFQLIETAGAARPGKLAQGIVERIGGTAGYSFKTENEGSPEDKNVASLLITKLRRAW